MIITSHVVINLLPFSRSGRAARINARSAATSWKRWRIVEIFHSETTYQPNPGKQISLEFPGINLLQIQVTTKDFGSWIHYWTIPLTSFVRKFLQSTPSPINYGPKRQGQKSNLPDRPMIKWLNTDPPLTGDYHYVTLKVLRPFCRPKFCSCVNLIMSKRMIIKDFSGSEKLRNCIVVK